MSDPASFDRLRHGALAMLADGNGVEAVAHLMAVPVDTVRAWHEGREPVAAPAEPAPAPARHASPRVRFDDELVHAMPASSRAIAMMLSGAIAVCGGAFGLWALRSGSILNGLMILMVTALSAWSLARLAPRSLVLGTDSVTVPAVSGGRGMAYSDIAGYTIEPRSMSLGFRTRVPGRVLSLRSRRPGAEPLEAFIPDDNPVDRRIFERLDEAVEANRDAPPLPATPGRVASTSEAPALNRLPLFAIGLVGALQLWPMFSASLGTLAHGTPPLAALRHVEGRVTGTSECWQRTRRGSAKVLTVGIERAGGGSEDLELPCLVDPHAMTRGAAHRVAVDFDPDVRPRPEIYQLSLDGRMLLSYEEASATHRRGDLVAISGVVMPLLFVIVVFGGLLLAPRLRRRAAPPS